MANSPFLTDAVGRQVRLPRCPERIISLVPSQTELLVDLGVGERLVGRTRYCIHPREKLASVAVVGGTKRVEFDEIQALKPDLILAEKEENPREMVDSLAGLAPVYVTDVTSIASAISMCRDVGRLIGQVAEAQALADQIQIAMHGAERLAPKPDRVLYLIWRKPWMAAGVDTFIHSCLEHVGFENAVSGTRYPELDHEKIVSLNPDRVFLSSEPFPFKDAHAQELRELLPGASIEFVDGELFSWYGSRMLKMPAYWRSLLLLDSNGKSRSW
jgi:ABC-type Fe3+-hydroxamate transport system substrate-binding protein